MAGRKSDWELYRELNQAEASLDIIRRQLEGLAELVNQQSATVAFASRELAIRLEAGLAERKAAQAE